ncbi:MAG: hypothetical protein ABI890_01240 [Lapillicoccus sp.]
MKDTEREALNAVAASQCALLTRAQLHRHGMTDRAIEWRVTSKRWRIVQPGVYLTSPGRSDWAMSAMAAVLFCGTGAVLSHRSAGHTFGLLPSPPDIVEILIPHGRTVVAPSAIRVRRCHGLLARTDDAPLSLPRTGIEHTVLDIAEDSDADGAIAIVATACRMGLTWDEGLRTALAGRKRHRWRVLLGDALVEVGEGAQSVLEVRYVRDVERAHGLPQGTSQQATARGKRHHDRGYPDQHLLVELQGLAFHSSASAQIRDGRRVREGLGEGWTTVPAYWSDVVVTPCALAVEVGTLLGLRGWSGVPHRCRRRDCVVR